MADTLPSIGDLVELREIEQCHRDYVRKATAARFLRHTYLGTGGYELNPVMYRSDSKLATSIIAQDTYLEPHPSEQSSDFQVRVSRAQFPPLARTRVVQPICGYLTKRTPTREGYHPDVEKWRVNATPQNEHLDLFVKRTLLPWGLVYGSLVVSVDADSAAGVSLLDRQNRGSRRAFLSAIHPESILDWARDEAGKLISIKWVSRDVREGMRATPVHRYWWFLAEGWFYVDVATADSGVPKVDKYPVRGAGEWPPDIQATGRAPLAEFLTNRDSTSVVGDISGTLLRLFNVLSEKAQIERGQCFSTLVAPGAGKDTLEKVKIGVHNVLTAPRDANWQPFYLAPPRGPLDQLTAEVARLQKEAIELANLSFSGEAPSAAAKAFQFQQTDRMLSAFAGALEAWESDAMQLVEKWLQVKSADPRTTYPNTFDAVDAERATTASIAILTEETGLSKTAIRLVRDRLATISLPNASEDDMRAIRDEHEEIANEPDPEPAPATPGNAPTDMLTEAAPSAVVPPDTATR